MKIKLDTYLAEVIQDNLDHLANRHIEWGILDDHKYATGSRAGKSVAEIAILNELGLDTINDQGQKVDLPSRPFFGNSIPSAVEVAREGSLSIFLSTFKENSDLNAKMEKVSKMLAQTIRDSINRQNFVPLSPKTIKLKGGKTEILKDTNKLFNSIVGRIIGSALR